MGKTDVKNQKESAGFHRYTRIKVVLLLCEIHLYNNSWELKYT